jgi:hypothetical protein
VVKETTSCDKDSGTIGCVKLGLLIALAIASARLVIWATVLGPGTEQDSCSYVCAAQSLVAERTLYECDDKWLLNNFPPLYPVILGVGSLSGAAPLTVARYVGAISCAASVILMGTILYAATSSSFIALLGGASIICVGDVAIRYLYAMTEGLFIALMLLFILSLWRAVADGSSAWLMLGGCAAALSCLTRYMGASLIFTGTSGLVFLGAGPSTIRLRRAALFVTISGSPIAAWLIHNHLEAGSAFNRFVTWHPLGASDLALGSTTIAHWAYPPISGQWAVWSGFLLVAIGTGLLAAILWTNPAPLEWLLANLILCNIGFIVLSRCFFDPLVLPHPRMLSPVFVAGLLLFLCAIGSNAAKNRAGAAWRSIGLVLVLVFLYANAFAAAPILYMSRVRGLGGTTRYYADSDLIRWIRRLPSNVAIYSDEPEPIRLFADHSAQLLPLLRDPHTQEPDKQFGWKVAAMLNTVSARTAEIVYFYKANHWVQDNLPTLAEMPRVYNLSMKPLLKTAEGNIYEVRPAATP